MCFEDITFVDRLDHYKLGQTAKKNKVDGAPAYCELFRRQQQH